MKLSENFGHATQAQITQLEAQYQVVLPDDYRQFLLATNGGLCNYEYEFPLTVGDDEYEIVMDVFYGIDVNSNVAIATYTDMEADERWPHMLAIGTDLASGSIMMITAGTDRGVYYYDSMGNIEGSADDGTAYYICDTFTDFVKIITAGSARGEAAEVQ